MAPTRTRGAIANGASTRRRRAIGRLGSVWKRENIVPSVVYFANLIVSNAIFHFELQVPWEWFQLLDRVDLEAHPIMSLLLLHGQPPLLNSLLVTGVQLEKHLGLPAIWFFAVIFRGLGLLGSIVLYRLAASLTRSPLLGMLVLLCTVSEPGYHIFQSLVFYEVLDLTFMILVLWFAWRFLAEGGAGSFAWCAISLSLLTLSRSMFHPLWTVATLGSLLVLGWRVAPVRAGVRRLVAIMAITALGLMLWPLKNWIVFGQATYSSWIGYNLARATPNRSEDIEKFRTTGIFPGKVRDYPLPNWIGEDGRHQLLKPWKVYGDVKGANWNHMIFLAENRRLIRLGLQWRIQNPGKWFSLVPYFYSCYTLSPVLNPYTRGILLGPEEGAFPVYTRTYLRCFYPDVYPWLGSRLGWPPQDGRRRPDSLYARRRALTLYGAVILPAAILFVLAKATMKIRTRDPAVSFMAFCAWIIVSLLLASVLTDGQEGMRFRFVTIPVTNLVLGLLAAEIWTWGRTSPWRGWAHRFGAR